jgi:hypothetical protein
VSRKLNKLLGKAEEHLDSDEEVVKAVVGTYKTKIMENDSVRKGLLAASNHRLIFYAKKMVATTSSPSPTRTSLPSRWASRWSWGTTSSSSPRATK